MRRLRCYLWDVPGAGAERRAEKEDHVLSQTRAAAHDAAAVDATLMARSTTQSGKQLLDAILNSLNDDKAEDVVSIDLRGKSEIADYMVICSGRSSRQVAAISEKLTERLKAEHGVISKIEGKAQGDWVLIDAGDVIVHVFRPEVRDFYQLEKMWMDPAQAAARR